MGGSGGEELGRGELIEEVEEKNVEVESVWRIGSGILIVPFSP